MEEPVRRRQGRPAGSKDTKQRKTRVVNKRNGRLTMQKAKRIRRLKQAGMSTAWLAVHFGVSKATIYAILQERIWKPSPPRTPRSVTPNGTDADLATGETHDGA